MRDWLLTLAVIACGKDAAAPSAAPIEGARPAETESSREATTGTDRAAAAPPHRSYPDLAAALVATIPPDARVVGFGELHARTDRAPATSTLASFTHALPAIADRLSDLVVETWLIDPACGQPAVAATARIETAVRRPETTKSELAELTDAARAARVQPHAMTLRCADYAALAPPGREVDPVALLTLTTRELGRIVTSAVSHRDRDPSRIDRFRSAAKQGSESPCGEGPPCGESGHRPWIAVYGGALHNDRFPDPSVAEWSYAAQADRATGGHFVEIDLIVPELAAADPVMQREPWFALVGAAPEPQRPVRVFTRGERSFVVILAPRPPA